MMFVNKLFTVMSNKFAIIMQCFNSINLVFDILKKIKKISKTFKETYDNLQKCMCELLKV